MTKPNAVDNCATAAKCYAMIVYQPPSWFTALEQAKFDYGTHAERIEVLTEVCIRGLGIPLKVSQSSDTNYSSARLDAERFANVHPPFTRSP